MSKPPSWEEEPMPQPGHPLLTCEVDGSVPLSQPGPSGRRLVNCSSLCIDNRRLAGPPPQPLPSPPNDTQFTATTTKKLDSLAVRRAPQCNDNQGT
eukprot:365152-Chlamydomonas_euryale.AAC.2